MDALAQAGGGCRVVAVDRWAACLAALAAFRAAAVTATACAAAAVPPAVAHLISTVPSSAGLRAQAALWLEPATAAVAGGGRQQPLLQCGAPAVQLCAAAAPRPHLEGPAEHWRVVQGNAKLVAGLIQKLGLHQPVIVGHSQGALVAMDVFRRRARTQLTWLCHFHASGRCAMQQLGAAARQQQALYAEPPGHVQDTGAGQRAGLCWICAAWERVRVRLCQEDGPGQAAAAAVHSRDHGHRGPRPAGAAPHSLGA